MILLIDNYDSFVYNLARYVRELGEEPVVRRHDAIDRGRDPGDAAVAHHHLAGTVLAGGGGHLHRGGPPGGTDDPDPGRLPGAPVHRRGLRRRDRAGRPADARQDLPHPPSRAPGSSPGFPTPFYATRYHSLVIAPASVPADLEVTATSEDGEIMAVQHVRDPVYGVQFHPESVLTEHGYRLLDHFLHGVPATPRAASARGRRRAGARHDAERARSPRPPAGGPGPVIIETIVTTHGLRRAPSTSPRWGWSGARTPSSSSRFSRPPPSATSRASRAAVVNLTDDVMLFAQGGISSPHSLRSRPRWCGASCSRPPAPGGRWRPVRGCHAAPLPDRGPGGASGRSAGVHRLQPGPARRARGGDPRHPHPSAPGRADPGGVRPAPDHRGQDRGPSRAGGDGAADGRMSTPDSVFVEAGARLHFGVLDLRGALGRRFGGLGAAVPHPSLLLEARPASTVAAQGAGLVPRRGVRSPVPGPPRPRRRRPHRRPPRHSRP